MRPNSKDMKPSRVVNFFNAVQMLKQVEMQNFFEEKN